MDLNLINNPVLCRICIKETVNVMSIYSIVQIVSANVSDNVSSSDVCENNECAESDSVKIVDMLLKCFPIIEVRIKDQIQKNEKIEEKCTCLFLQIKNDDELPKQICFDCVEKLNITFDFWKLIEQSQQIFQSVHCIEIPDPKVGNTLDQELTDQKNGEENLFETPHDVSQKVQKSDDLSMSSQNN